MKAVAGNPWFSCLFLLFIESERAWTLASALEKVWVHDYPTLRASLGSDADLQRSSRAAELGPAALPLKSFPGTTGSLVLVKLRSGPASLLSIKVIIIAMNWNRRDRRVCRVDSSPGLAVKGHDSTPKALKLKKLRKGTGRAKIVLLVLSHLVLDLILFCILGKERVFRQGKPCDRRHDRAHELFRTGRPFPRGN
jgi:hypothetical protein